MSTTKAARRLHALRRATARAELLEPRRLLAAQAHHWPAGPEVQVSAFAGATPSKPVMAMDADGDYVIAWNRFDGSTGGIYARRYDAAGVPQGSEFRVTTDTLNYEVQPAVAMD